MKKWCDNQCITKEDKNRGTFTCLAHLAEGRALQCPYRTKEERQESSLQCCDYEEVKNV